VAVGYKLPRGTLANLDAKVAGSTIVPYQPYWITDQNRLAIGLTTTTYEKLPTKPEVDAKATKYATRSAMAGVTSANGDVAYLTEAGREGNFVYSTADNQTNVTNDPNQGIYVAPTADTDGSSGAWVRRIDGPAVVTWWGTTGDGSTNDGAAILAAIATLKYLAVNATGGFYKASRKLYFPPGHYFMGTNTIEITHTITLEGDGSGLPASAKPALLRWSAGATGIRVQRYNTSGDTGTTTPGFNGGDNSIIRGLHLKGGFAGTEGEFHGIHLRARAHIDHCEVEGFQGDGLYSRNASGGSPEGNANLAMVSYSAFRANRRGIYFDSADSNACLIMGTDMSGNRTWGLHDSSFLGNTYLMCHFSGNGWDGAISSTPTAVTLSGNRYYPKPGQDANWATTSPSGTTADNAVWGYNQAGGTYNGVVTWTNGVTVRMGGAVYVDTNNNAANVFIGCYSEGDQNPSWLDSTTTVVVGGLHGAQIKGPNYGFLKGYGGGVGVESNAYKNGGFLAVDTPTGNNVGIYSMGINFAHATNGDYSLQWLSNDLVYTVLNSGVSTNWAFKLTGEATSSPLGSRKMDFPNGFGLAGKKMYSGTAVPSSGTWATGDRVFNSAPSAGGPRGWVCVSGGTPGTWEDVDKVAITTQTVSATARFIGRTTAGAGQAEELTGTQATAMLDTFTTTLKGLVPAPSTSTKKYLRDDGTWFQDIRTITYIIDGGGAAITTGVKGDVHIPFGCTITEWTLLADQSGSIVVDIWKDTYANAPPVVGDSITASAKPTLSSAAKNQSSTLTGWSPAITANSVLRFNVDSATTVQRVTLSLKVTVD
jgi:hypothetical protein